MVTILSAVGYAWLSHALAFLLMPWSLPYALRIRSVVLWAFAALLLFFLQDWLLVMLLVACAAFLVAPSLPAERAAFFLIAAPCLPFFLRAPLPFPGLNVLLELTPYILTAVALLLPLFFARRTKLLKDRAVSTLDICLIAYVIYTAIIVGGALNATTGLRIMMEQALTLALPYLALRYAFQSTKHVEGAFDAFLIASVLLAAICLIATLKQWDFYWLVQRASIMTLPDYRSGLLRIQATANTHSLGYHLAAALLILQCVKDRLSIGRMHLLALRLILLLGLLVTDSRGAMVSLALAILGYQLIMLRSNTARLLLLLAAVVASVAVAIWLLNADTSTIDEHGTISYRQEMIRVSLAHIQKFPFFGDYNFYADPAFEPLRQGQGIIDITNLYLLILLHYGGVGGVLYFAVIAIPIIALLRQTFVLNGQPVRRAGRRDTALSVGRMRVMSPEAEARLRTWQQLTATLAGIQIGWLFLVATTSNVALTAHLGFVFAALSRVMMAIGAEIIREVRSEERGEAAQSSAKLRAQPSR